MAEVGWLWASDMWLKKFPDKERDETRLSWHDLDILAKICESPLMSAHCEMQRRVWTIFAELRADAQWLQQMLDEARTAEED